MSLRGKIRWLQGQAYLEGKPLRVWLRQYAVPEAFMSEKGMYLITVHPDGSITIPNREQLNKSETTDST